MHDSHKTTPSPRSTPYPDPNLCEARNPPSTSERHTLGDGSFGAHLLQQIFSSFAKLYDQQSPWTSFTASRCRPRDLPSARQPAAQTQPQLFLMLFLKTFILQNAYSLVRDDIHKPPRQYHQDHDQNTSIQKRSSLTR